MSGINLISHFMQKLNWHQQSFILDHNRVMYWEAERTLICSDLHLGKTGHFRKAGIAVPQAIYQQDLQRLFSSIQYYNPAEVLLVGDLFHSNANKEWEWFKRWRLDKEHIKFTLIKGNHDKLPTGTAEAMQLEVMNYYLKNGFLFIHDPFEKLPENIEPLAIISGHMHPSILIQTGIRQKLRLPCFYFSGQQGILPAFSHFSGTYSIKPKKQDIVYAITGNELIAMH